MVIITLLLFDCNFNLVLLFCILILSSSNLFFLIKHPIVFLFHFQTKRHHFCCFLSFVRSFFSVFLSFFQSVLRPICTQHLLRFSQLSIHIFLPKRLCPFALVRRSSSRSLGSHCESTSLECSNFFVFTFFLMLNFYATFLFTNNTNTTTTTTSGRLFYDLTLLHF